MTGGHGHAVDDLRSGIQLTVSVEADVSRLLQDRRSDQSMWGKGEG